MSHRGGGPSSDPDRLLARVAAVALPEGAGNGRPVEIPERLWPQVFRGITRQRIIGLAVAGVRGGVLRLSRDHERRLFERHRNAMLLVVSLERRLLEVVDALQTAGAAAVALKGAAVAHTFYPNPSLRTYGDVDVLVRTDDWALACSALGDLGFRRILPEPRPRFDQRFGKGAAFVDPEGVEIDLHRTLALGAFGLWIDPAELFEGTSELRLGGKVLRRLDDTLSLLHVGVHASIGRPRPLLMPLRDVVQVAWAGEIDWDRLRALAERWRLSVPIGHALQTAAEVLEARIPEGAARLSSARSGRLERRVFTAYTTERAARGGIALSTLWGIRGLSGKAAYLRALLLPDREFLEARSGGRPGSYRSRWKTPLRWALQRLGGRKHQGVRPR
jgi:hypothetical protein